MTRKRSWSPADGPAAAPRQRPAARFRTFEDGQLDNELGALSTPSEGPAHADRAGPAGRQPAGN